MNGDVALKKIRELEKHHGYPRTKIIIASALSPNEKSATTFEGCDANLTKPFGEEKLDETLRKMGFDLYDCV